MSETSLQPEMPDGDAPSGLPGKTKGGPGKEIFFAGRYRIQPDVVLPHLATSSARAYVTIDGDDPANSLYALVLDRRIPARLTAIVNAKGIVHESMPRPVRWGRVDWTPSGREEIVIILHQPPGPVLMPDLDAQIQPWLLRELKRDLLVPMVELLKQMHDDRVTHRNIRPTNLFRNTEDGSVVSGQVFSAPPGFDQPQMFEPLDRARCHRTGRGTGEVSDDLYALGVTLMMLALGRNPMAGMSEEEIMRRRIAQGSYNAMLGTNKLPNELAPVVRSLMRDDEHERWSLADLAHWVHTGRVNPSQPAQVPRADRAFEIGGDQAYTPRELAYLFSQHWDEALKLTATEDIEFWIDRSLKDREMAKQVAESAEPGPYGPKQMTPEVRLSRIIAVLDPTGPITMRSLSVMPDGLATVTVSALGDNAVIRDYKDLILGKLMTFWHEIQVRPKSWMLTGMEIADKAAIYLVRTSAGFSIERCAYEFNPALPCLSPLLDKSAPLQVRELIQTMDKFAGDGDFLFDRHIAAFLGARIPGSIDRELAEIANADDDSEKRIAQLRLMAYAQSRNSSMVAKGLYDMFLKHLQPVLNQYRNIPMREKLHRAARKAAGRGNLNDLVRILDNRKNQSWDEKGFEIARRRHAQLEREIHRLKTDAEAHRRQSVRLGHQIAANIGSLFAVAAAVIVILVYMG